MDADQINAEGAKFAAMLGQVAKRLDWTPNDMMAVYTAAFVNMAADMGGEVNAVEYLRDIADDYERQIMGRA